MPQLNQKGPTGDGHMTGRRMGKCTNFGANAKQETSADNSTPTETSPENNTGRGFGFGKGLGQGRGMGMGRQHRFRNGQQ